MTGSLFAGSVRPQTKSSGGLFLSVGALVGGRVVGGAQLIAQGRFKFLEMLRQSFIDVLLLFRFLFPGEFFRFGFDFVRLLSIGIGVKRKQALVGRAPVFPVIGRFEHGADPVVIRLRNRIVAMIVALRAADGQPEQRRGDDLDRVRHDLVANGARISDGGRGGAIDSHAEEARGDKQLAQLRVGQRALWIVLGRVREFIAGELFGDAGSRATGRSASRKHRVRRPRGRPPLRRVSAAGP